MSWLSKALKGAKKVVKFDPILGPIVEPAILIYDNEKKKSDGKKKAAANAKRGPLPPQSFSAIRTDGGVQFKIIDRNPLIDRSGAVRYDIYWAQVVDLSTDDTIAAGFARATNVMSLPAPGVEGASVVRMLFGERYLQGFYYCVGFDAANNMGQPTPPIVLNDASNSGSYPDDVSHFDVSESGIVSNGVSYSEVSFIYQAPNDPRFAGVKFFIKDYPVINEIYETFLHSYRGERGGTGQDKFLLEVGRRKGTGTLTIVGTALTGVGSAFLSEMNAGDLLEVRGHIQTILSVTSNTVATLSAGWGGDAVAAVADWWIIPEVTIYAVSLAVDGSHREDIENAPSVKVFLDGLLSPPVSPVLTGDVDSNGVSTIGEVNRIEFNQLAGTEIVRYHAYKGRGAGLAYSACVHFATEEHNPHALGNGHHQIDDTVFETGDKESNQVFSYYLVAENAREQRSNPSTRVEIACRLNSAGSGDGSIPSRNGVLNVLYNAALCGTVGNNVDFADASQDTFNATGGPPTGWARWHSTIFGTAVTRAKHYNNDEIRFTAPGAAGQTFAYQALQTWASLADPRIRKGSLLTFQALIQHDGVLPNGTFYMYLELFDNGGGFLEYCPRRYRDGFTGELTFDAGTTIVTPASNVIAIDCSELLGNWQGFMGVFRPTDSLAAAFMRVTWGWEGGTVGNIRVTQPMLSYGEELCNWTGQMINTSLLYPNGGDPPGWIGDGPGHRDQLLPIQP